MVKKIYACFSLQFFSPFHCNTDSSESSCFATKMVFLFLFLTLFSLDLCESRTVLPFMLQTSPET